MARLKVVRSNRTAIMGYIGFDPIMKIKQSGDVIYHLYDSDCVEFIDMNGVGWIVKNGSWMKAEREVIHASF